MVSFIEKSPNYKNIKQVAYNNLIIIGHMTIIWFSNINFFMEIHRNIYNYCSYCSKWFLDDSWNSIHYIYVTDNCSFVLLFLIGDYPT